MHARIRCSVLCVLTLGLMPALAAEVFTPNHVARTRAVSSAQISRMDSTLLTR